MAQLAGDLGLALEAGHGLGVLGDRGRDGQDLDRKTAFEPFVGGLVDPPHAPLADEALYLVGTVEQLPHQFIRATQSFNRFLTCVQTTSIR